MHRFVPLALALAGLFLPSAQAEMAPELARVRSPDAYVWSGPGEQFYPTSRLGRGEPLEIYQRRADGWCAVRPPEGSFSYVRADHVRPEPSRGLLEVTGEGAKTRVGSALGPWNQVEYVALRRSEKLEPLGAPVRLGSTPGIWYRVAPPSGEFRWVQARDLQVTGRASAAEADGARATSMGGDRVDRVAPADRAGDLASLDSTTVSSPLTSAEIPPGRVDRSLQRQLRETINNPAGDSSPSSDGIALVKLARDPRQMATEPIPRQAVADGGDSHRLSHDVAVEADQSPTKRSAPDADAAPYLGQSGIWPEHADPNLRLAELELALSQMVTLDIHRWELDRLRQQAEWLSGQFVDEAGQRRVAQLLERIAEFAALRHRQQELDDLGMTPGNEQNRAMSVTAALSPEISTVGNVTGDSQGPSAPPGILWRRGTDASPSARTAHYAGQGWLVPVLSGHPHLPRFALTDQAGAIQAFVSPRAGLNLRRYLRQEVGIVGRDTARSDDATPHLLADRVVLLDRHR